MSSENAASQDSGSQRNAFAFVKEISSSPLSSTWLARMGGDETPADASSVRLTEVLRVNSHVTEKPDVKEGFVRDVQQAQDLKHPNIVAVEASLPAGKEIHIATQIVEGSTLFSLFAAAGTEGVGTDVLLRIALDVLAALSAAHALKPQAFAHGELTPQHVLVGSDGISRVSGFGVARALARVDPAGAKNQTRLGYAAPERVKAMTGPASGPQSVDFRSDLFSVAVMLWEGIAKQRLFSAKMDAAVIQKVLTAPIPPLASLPKVSVPPSVDAALLKALERDPSRRYQNADEFIAALQKAGDAAIASHEKVASLVEKLTGRTIAARRAELASALVAPAVTPPPLKETTVSTPNPSAPKTSVPMPPAAAKAAAAPAAAAKPVIPMPPGTSSNKASVPPPAAAAAVKTAIPAPAKTPAVAGGGASAAAPGKRPMAATLVGMPPAQDAAKGGKNSEIIDEATLDGEWLEDAAGGETGQIPAAPAVPKINVSAAKTALPAKAPAAPKPAAAAPAPAAKAAVPAAKPAAAAPTAPKPSAPIAAKPAALKTTPPVAPKPAAAKPAAPAPAAPAEAEAGAEAQKAAPAEAAAPAVPSPAKAPIAAPKPAASKPAAPMAPAARKAAVPAAKAAEAAPAAAERVSPVIPEAPAGEVKITLEEPPAPAEAKGTPSEIEVQAASAEVGKGMLRADAHDRITTGTTLGRYEILMPVAKGGMASVWAARLQGTRGFKKIVAVKTMLPDVSDDPEFESMFLDEARVAARIRHPNVVEIHDLGEENDVLYIVMEWVDGETLTTLMKAAKPKGGIPLPIMLRVASQICAGLHAAHELRDDNDVMLDLVHRDVSPGNVLVSSTGFVKVADFGIAKSKGRLHETRASGVLKGKAPYLSPEQLRGLQPDRRSDLFALGTVLYVMASGLHPFRGASEAKTMENIALMRPVPLREINPSIHAEFEKIIFKALEKDRNNRYTTAAEMQRAIDHLASSIGQPTTDEDVGAFVQNTIGDLIRERAKALRNAITAVDGPMSNSRPSYPSIDPKAIPTLVGADGAEAAPAENADAKPAAPEGRAPVEEDVTFDEEPLEGGQAAGEAAAAEPQDKGGAKADEAKAGDGQAPEKAAGADTAKSAEPAPNKEGVSAEALVGLLAGSAAAVDENKPAEAKPAAVESAFNVAALAPPASSETALSTDDDFNALAPKKRKPLPFILGGAVAAGVLVGVIAFSGGGGEPQKTTAESAANTAVAADTAAPTAQPPQPEKTAEAAPPAETAAAAATQAPSAEPTAAPAPEPSAEAAPPPAETAAPTQPPPVAAAPKPKQAAPVVTTRPPPTRPTPPKTTPPKTPPKKFNPTGI